MKWKKRVLQVLLCVIVLVTGGIGIAVLYIMDSSGLWNNKNGFYATKQFCYELEGFMQGTIGELREREKLPITGLPQENSIIYKMLDFSAIEEDKKEGSINYEKSMEKAYSASFGELCQEEKPLRENVICGQNVGSQEYYFYDEWSQESENALKKVYDDTSEPIEYLCVSNGQFIELLNKYAVENSDEGEYYFVNEKTNHKVFYSFREDYGVFYSLTTRKNTYSYDAYNDILKRDKFYFVSDNLDWTSKENLEKSIITTAFTTVKQSLTYFALRDWISENSKYDFYYDEEYLAEVEFTYQLELVDGTVVQDEVKQLEPNQIAKEITFFADSKSLDGTSEKEYEDGILLVNKDLCDMLKQNQIASMTIYIPKNLSFTTGRLGESMQIYKVYKEFDVIGVCAVVGVVLCLLLIGYLIVVERKEKMTKYDNWCLELRSIITGIILLSVTCGVYVCAEICDSFRWDFICFIIAFIVLAYVIVYCAIYYYMISIFRNIYQKRGWSQSVIIRTVKRVNQGVIEFVAALWNRQEIAKQSLIYCGGYGLLNIVGMFFFLCLLDSPICLLVLLGLILANLYVCRSYYNERRNLDVIMKGLRQINDGNLTCQIDNGNMSGFKKELAELVNHVGEGLEKAVATSIRDERLKAELITNVSHDIKTPLTSIINYVDLLKREEIKEKPASEYIEVLDQKSLRLKQLIEDLVEASKASTGNIDLTCDKLDMKELVIQTMGEFEDKLQEKELTVIATISPEPLYIYADGRRCFRIIENLFSNVYKYSLEGTRVYVSLQQKETQVVFEIKNISRNPLNIDAEELSQRFVRGEESRTTEGSGLGLSIAKSLTELQHGEFEIALDGDLFKVMVTFPKVDQGEVNIE